MFAQLGFENVAVLVVPEPEEPDKALTDLIKRLVLEDARCLASTKIRCQLDLVSQGKRTLYRSRPRPAWRQ